MKKVLLAVCCGLVVAGAHAQSNDLCAMDVTVTKQSVKSLDDIRKTYGQLAKKTAWYPSDLYSKIDTALQMQINEARMNVLNQEAVVAAGNKKVCNTAYGLDMQKKMITLSGSVGVEIEAMKQVEDHKDVLRNSTECTSASACNDVYLKAFFMVEKQLMDNYKNSNMI